MDLYLQGVEKQGEVVTLGIKNPVLNPSACLV